MPNAVYDDDEDDGLVFVISNFLRVHLLILLRFFFHIHLLHYCVIRERFERISNFLLGKNPVKEHFCVCVWGRGG